jgi:hypothetical protein
MRNFLLLICVLMLSYVALRLGIRQIRTEAFIDQQKGPRPISHATQ